MAHEKTCLCCKYVEISFGSRGYSEMTPGDPGYYECTKGHYPSKDNYPENFDNMMQMAKTCKDFEHR